MIFYFFLLLNSYFIDSYQWNFQENYGSKSGDFITLTGQGSVYLATTDSFNNIVDIYLSYYNNNKTNFGHVAKISKQNTNGFGQVIAFVENNNNNNNNNDLIYEKILFIGEKNDYGQGKAYIYSGSWNHWTNTQILEPPEIFQQYGQFSSYIESDRTNSRVAIGCPYCNITKYAGQIYIYEKSDDENSNQWINTDVINTKYVDYLKNPQLINFFLGGLISFDNKVLLGSTLTYRSGNDFIWGFTIFTQSSTTNRWSQQQTITSSVYDSSTQTLNYYNIDIFAVSEETIVFSSVSQRYKGIENVGAVSILYPNTKQFISPYTPTPTILTSESSENRINSIYNHNSHQNYNQDNHFNFKTFENKLSQSTFLSPRERRVLNHQIHNNKKQRKYNNYKNKETEEFQLKAKENYGFQFDKQSESNNLDYDLSERLDKITRELNFDRNNKVNNQNKNQNQNQNKDKNFNEDKVNLFTKTSESKLKYQTTSAATTTSTTRLVTRELSWSTRQVLYPPEQTPVAQSNFGSDLSLHKNILIIGEQGESRVYYYARKDTTVLGYWSYQQTLYPSTDSVLFYSDNYLYNSYLLNLGLIATEGSSELTSISMNFYLNDITWKCLLIQIEDTFGDGWGNDIYLVLTTPSGKKNYYTLPFLSLDIPNPYVFRYCPDSYEYDYYQSSSSSSSSSVLSYTFEIQKKDSFINVGSFFWEIQYRVFIEGQDLNTDIIYGNYATKILYTFDWSLKQFNLLTSYRRLLRPLDLTCLSCRIYTTSDITSYVATLSDPSSWRYLNMFTNTNTIPWYNQNDPYHSTSYYISDIYGSKLIYSGTMCLNDINQPDNGIIHSCWMDIPSDGTYLLRISGALYLNSTSLILSSTSTSDNLSDRLHSWNFCGQSGYINSHVYFTVLNNGRNCIINAIYPIDIYKQDNLQTFIYIDGKFNVVRTIQTKPDGNLQFPLTAYDRSLFSHAINSVLLGLSVRDFKVNQNVDVPIENVHNNIVTFSIIINIQNYDGGDTRDYYSMKSIASTIIDEINTGVLNGNILRVLKSTTLVPQSTFFTSSIGLSISADLKMRDQITIIPSVPPVDQIEFWDE